MNITHWLDVFPSESVKLRCSMDNRFDWKYTWYKDGEEVQAATVSLKRNELSIKSASEQHQGQYTCKGHLQDRPVSSQPSSGLVLTVHSESFSIKLLH